VCVYMYVYIYIIYGRGSASCNLCSAILYFQLTW